MPHVASITDGLYNILCQKIKGQGDIILKQEMCRISSAKELPQNYILPTVADLYIPTVLEVISMALFGPGPGIVE